MREKKSNTLEERLLRRKQIVVFAMSYLANFLVLFGYSIEYVIAVYYNHPTVDTPGLQYQDLQATLLLTSIIFFALGSVLEYVKKSNLLISFFVFLIGVLKLSVRRLRVDNAYRTAS